MENNDIDNSQESNTIVYTIRWNPVKSARLKRIRGVSFEELIIDGRFLDYIESPHRPGQWIFLLKYRGYVWAVPFVVEGKEIFLKTLYQSRKFNKIYKER